MGEGTDRETYSAAKRQEYAVGQRVGYVNAPNTQGVVSAVTDDGYRIEWDDGYEDMPGKPGCYRAHELLALVHEPDHMGIWTDSGDVVWLPRSFYPKRNDAIKWGMEQFGCGFLDIRCHARWMRYEPFVARKLDGSVAWQKDEWYECSEADPGAFKVWKLS